MVQVSIIIPTYNRAAFLAATIRSVLRQSYTDFELIVVDDGSNDETMKIVSRFADRVRYIYQTNKGASAARNRGIKSSSGSYIAFLDSDDVWLPEKLKIQMDYFESNPDRRICYTDEIWIRNGKQVNQERAQQKYSGWIFPHCLRRCFIGLSSVVIHRSLFEDIGVFDESLMVCEDYDLWLRISAVVPIALVEQKLTVKQAGHKDQLSFRYWGMDRSRVYAINKILQNNTLNAENQLAAKRILIQKCHILANGFYKRGKHTEADYYRSLSSQYESWDHNGT